MNNNRIQHEGKTTCHQGGYRLSGCSLVRNTFGCKRFCDSSRGPLLYCKDRFDMLLKITILSRKVMVQSLRKEEFVHDTVADAGDSR